MIDFSLISYFKKNVISVILSNVIIFTFSVIFLYLHLISNLKLTKSAFNKNRCNPLYMPFSGILDESNKKSNVDHAMLNYMYCTTGILKNSSKASLQDIKNTNAIIDAQAKDMINYTGKLVNNSQGLKKSSFKGSSLMDDKLGNLSASISLFIEQGKSVMNRALAISTTGTYTMRGGGLTVVSLIKMIMNVIIIIMSILLTLITITLVLGGVLMLVPFFGWIAAIILFIFASKALGLLTKFIDIAAPAIESATEIIDTIVD
jgi:hypothetical protein